jgi:ABC-type transporter MlaC component
VLLVGILAYAIFSPEDGRVAGTAPPAIPVSSTATAKPAFTATAIPSADPTSTVPVTVEESAAAAERREVLQTLHAYYRDLNAGKFDAERYFAPRISLYISMKNATPTTLNRYYKNDHPRMYHDFEARMLEDTLQRKGAHTFTYREESVFLQTSDKRRRKMTTEVTVTVNDSAKITSLAHSRISG